ncbi:hypothetical protein D3C81_1815120 [compost metagenome]
MERGHKRKAGKRQGKILQGNIQLHQVRASCGYPQAARQEHGSGKHHAVGRLLDEQSPTLRHNPDKGHTQHRQESQQQKACAPVAAEHMHHIASLSNNSLFY